MIARTSLHWFEADARHMPDADEALLLHVPSLDRDTALVGTYQPGVGFRTASSLRIIPTEKVLAWAYWPEVPAVYTRDHVAA